MDPALDFLARFLADYAYVGLFLILSVGAFGFPIPEEIVLAVAGLFVAQGQTRLLPTLIACGFGMALGDFFLYLVGRRYGTEAFHGVIRRVVPPERIERVRGWLSRWGLLVVFFGRYLTGVRPAVFLGAGASGIPVSRFVLVDGSSALVNLFIWVFVGKAASEYLELLLQAVTRAEGLILAAVLAVLLVLLLERVLVRYGTLGRQSAPVRITNFVRVPILLVTAAFAVIAGRGYQIASKGRLLEAVREGRPADLRELGLLMDTLPVLTEPGQPAELVLVGARELVLEALAQAEFRETAEAAAPVSGALLRAPELLLGRHGAGSGPLGLWLWRSHVQYRSRPVWIGQFSREVSIEELKAMSYELTRTRYAPRTLVGPPIRQGERRRVVIAVLHAPRRGEPRRR